MDNITLNDILTAIEGLSNEELCYLIAYSNQEYNNRDFSEDGKEKICQKN